MRERQVTIHGTKKAQMAKMERTPDGPIAGTLRGGVELGVE